MSSHHRFIEKIDINFILLSDEDKKVSKLYGVDKLIGVERATFIIDKQGNIVEEYRKVKPKGHGQKVLDWIKENQENL